MHIYINSEPNLFSTDKDGVYGHEQLHIDAYNTEINTTLKKYIEGEENKNVCSKDKSAATLFATALEGNIATEFTKIVNNGVTHQPPHPKAGTPMPVQGTMPAKPSAAPTNPKATTCDDQCFK
jgi:hypothetical protein